MRQFANFLSYSVPPPPKNEKVFCLTQSLLNYEEGGSNEINLEEGGFLKQNLYTLITVPTKITFGRSAYLKKYI